MFVSWFILVVNIVSVVIVKYCPVNINKILTSYSMTLSKLLKIIARNMCNINIGIRIIFT